MFSLIGNVLIVNNAPSVYSLVAKFMLPDTSKGASWFGNYFCTVKNRVNELKKELEAEAGAGAVGDVGSARVPAITVAYDILSAPLPELEPSLSEFYRTLDKTCTNLQMILLESNMVSPPSSLSEVLSGGFQSGCGPDVLAKALVGSTNSRKAVEKKVRRSESRRTIQ